MGFKIQRVESKRVKAFQKMSDFPARLRACAVNSRICGVVSTAAPVVSTQAPIVNTVVSGRVALVTAPSIGPAA